MLLTKEVIALAKYIDFADVFLKELANVHPEQIGVNEHTIKLEKDKQLSYRPIYSLKLVELKIFKTYIKTNLANSFIRALKSLARALILFAYKPNDSLRLCINY